MSNYQVKSQVQSSKNVEPISKEKNIENIEFHEILPQVKIEDHDNVLQEVVEEAKGGNMELLKRI